MQTRTATTLATATAFFLLAAGAQANSIFFSETTLTVNINDGPFPIDLLMDFTDPTLGGGVTLNLVLTAPDPGGLDPGEIVFNNGPNIPPEIGTDIDFRCPTDPAALNPIPCTTPGEIVWGNFGTPLSGQLTVGTFQFDPLSEGLVGVEIDVTRTFASPTGQPLEVSTTGVLINIVPEPSTFALLALGGLGLGLLRRRRLEG